MSTVSVIREHIEITPGVCGGRPRITGHRITVQDIVVWHDQMGMSPDEIAARHPQLSLADVHAALAYYHDHRESIHERMAADEEIIRDLEARQPSILQTIAERRHAPHTEVPPG